MFKIDHHVSDRTQAIPASFFPWSLGTEEKVKTGYGSRGTILRELPCIGGKRGPAAIPFHPHHRGTFCKFTKLSIFRCQKMRLDEGIESLCERREALEYPHIIRSLQDM
jgi:hypothetical protein